MQVDTLSTVKPDIQIKMTWDEAEKLKGIVGEVPWTSITSDLYEALNGILSER